jgi:hypothetical protein
MDTKRENISELLYDGVSISHSIIDKAKYDDKETEKMRRDIASLINQVSYYK